MANVGHFKVSTQAQQRVFSFAGKQALVDNPAVRSNASTGQLLLQALSFMHRRSFRQGDNQYACEIRITQSRQQFHNAFWHISLCAQYLTMEGFGSIEQ